MAGKDFFWPVASEGFQGVTAAGSDRVFGSWQDCIAETVHMSAEQESARTSQ